MVADASQLKRGATPVDVVLFLEGTYPFVPGGVSSWVHGIISGMPDFSFGLIFLGADYVAGRELKFAIPSNVKYIEEVAVYDQFFWSPPLSGDRRAAYGALKTFIMGMQDGRITNFEELFRYVGGAKKALSMKDLTQSRAAWRILREVYEARAKEISFIDFFWTWRFAYFPVFQLLYTWLPPAKLYHTICTGWAGLLSVLARRRWLRPLILTEHGIYTNERRIEISQAEWIYTQERDDLVLRRDLGYFKELWINIFESLGRLTYDYCDEIFTLYGGNRNMEIAFGAPPDRIGIIPNGVRIGTFKSERPPKQEGAPKTVGFVGRVVPIKDVKTLIRACRIVAEKVPDVEILILGPTEEDQEYFEECVDLTNLMGLQEKVKFMGKVNVKDYYPLLDVMVLTSVSEGQPLVILEGYCSGVPCVATNVGACSELINGMEGEDAALGPAGFVTSVGSPQETADGIIRLLTDEALWERCSTSARERVRRYYDYDDMIRRYHDIYLKYLAADKVTRGPVSINEPPDRAEAG
jgi:glycosyltransferase involved in cell wall biosynthesis